MGAPASAPVRLIGGQYEIERRWPVVALALLTYLLCLPLFAPWSVWPLGYVAMVPWITAVCISRRSGWVYLISYALGAAYILTHMRWLYDTTPPGYIAGSLYLALSFPLAAIPVRHMYRSRGLSVAIAFPIFWTASEFLRSSGPLGMPWFLLGHSQIRVLSMIQIADVTGAYGVSFVVAMVNGWLVDLLLRPILVWQSGRAISPRVGPIGTIVLIVLVGATLIYGRYRLSSGQFREGPAISVLQGDYALTPDGFNMEVELSKPRTYERLMSSALEQNPDMVVLPETPWSMYLNPEMRSKVPYFNRSHERFLEVTSTHKTYVVVGALTEIPQPAGEYPPAHRYNSSFVYSPGTREPDRYDKIHLVPFGEFVPLRYAPGLHWLYLWMNRQTPWGSDGTEYSLTEGNQFKTFTMQERSPGGSAYRFGVTICYEDAIPRVFRRFVANDNGGKRVDFMLNISNDGWFGHGSQQPQHLVACAFRAVENRVGIARSVNTGVSGFIDPDGRWRDLVPDPDGPPHAGGTGYRTARVKIDSRLTLYSRYGDIFAGTCTLLMLATLADGTIVRRRLKRAPTRAEPPGAATP